MDPASEDKLFQSLVLRAQKLYSETSATVRDAFEAWGLPLPLPAATTSSDDLPSISKLDSTPLKSALHSFCAPLTRTTKNVRFVPEKNFLVREFNPAEPILTETSHSERAEEHLPLKKRKLLAQPVAVADHTSCGMLSQQAVVDPPPNRSHSPPPYEGEISLELRPELSLLTSPASPPTQVSPSLPNGSESSLDSAQQNQFQTFFGDPSPQSPPKDTMTPLSSLVTPPLNPRSKFFADDTTLLTPKKHAVTENLRHSSQKQHVPSLKRVIPFTEKLSHENSSVIVPESKDAKSVIRKKVPLSYPKEPVVEPPLKALRKQNVENKKIIFLPTVPVASHQQKRMSKPEKAKKTKSAKKPKLM